MHTFNLVQGVNCNYSILLLLFFIPISINQEAIWPSSNANISFLYTVFLHSFCNCLEQLKYYLFYHKTQSPALKSCTVLIYEVVTKITENIYVYLLRLSFK